MYDFVDTIEHRNGALLPSEAMKFNGVYLENEIPGYRTLQVSGREILENEIIESEIGVSDGARYRRKRYPVRIITVKYSLRAANANAFRKAYNRLNTILDAENAQLIFDDEPDKYFIGTKQSGSDVPPGTNIVTGEIEFRCSDPFKYAVAETRVSGIGNLTLTNEGNKETPVNVKVKMKSENGYIGLVLGERFYQIGNPGEVDKEEKERTEILFDDHFTKDRGWILNKGITPPVTPSRAQTGNVAFEIENLNENEGFMRASSYGDESVYWHGPSMTKMIPSDSQGKYPVNWRAEWRFDFNTDGSPNKPVEIGHSSVTFSDQNDNIIVAVVFEDNNPVYERSDMAIYVGNNRVWDTKEVQKFYVTGRGSSGPLVIVEKISNDVTVSFTYGGVKKTFKVKNPNAELRKVTWYCAAYKGHNPIRNNNIRAMNIRKHNVQYVNDIPNYFQKGDVMELDSDSNQVYVNNILNWDRVDIGSRPLMLDPGAYMLGVIVSEWAESPEIEVTFRERWL